MHLVARLHASIRLRQEEEHRRQRQVAQPDSVPKEERDIGERIRAPEADKGLALGGRQFRQIWIQNGFEMD